MPFLVGAQQIDRDLHRIAEMYFAQIAHMALGREGRAVALLHVGRADAELQPHLVDAAVEQHIVIGHVEMAVIVDPLLFDLHHRGEERRRLAAAHPLIGSWAESSHSLRARSEFLTRLYILCHASPKAEES